MLTRCFSSYAATLKRNVPRFVNTLKEASNPAVEHLEVVSRPFGFDSPITVADTFSVSEFFGNSAAEKRQRQLDHDIKHSPFYDSKSFSNTQGKIFTPPVSYFKRDKSKFFPNIVGENLQGNTVALQDVIPGKVSIVRIFSTISGERCTNTYVEDNLTEIGYTQLQEKYKNAQIVDYNIPQSWIKGLFVKMAKSNLRKIVPSARHDKYFILPNTLFGVDIRKVLKCDNNCSGYIYVLDDDGRIRWATSGYANESEKAILWRAVEGINREINSKRSPEPNH